MMGNMDHVISMIAGLIAFMCGLIIFAVDAFNGNPESIVWVIILPIIAVFVTKLVFGRDA